MDRRLFAEPPVISSTLRWEDVVLPDSISEAELDRILLAGMTPQFRKTALVIHKGLERCGELGLPIDADMLGARLVALAETNRIDSAGDQRKWRYSEVRLKS